MAVDTKAKRFSMMTFGELPWEWDLNPDNEIDADDRYSFMGLYGRTDGARGRRRHALGLEEG